VALGIRLRNIGLSGGCGVENGWALCEKAPENGMASSTGGGSSTCSWRRGGWRRRAAYLRRILSSAALLNA